VVPFACYTPIRNHGTDKHCSDFSAWRQAESLYKKHARPKRDPHRLDADHDGIACESLR
jgi:hypothetical protein